MACGTETWNPDESRKSVTLNLNESGNLPKYTNVQVSDSLFWLLRKTPILYFLHKQFFYILYYIGPMELPLNPNREIIIAQHTLMDMNHMHSMIVMFLEIFFSLLA